MALPPPLELSPPLLNTPVPAATDLADLTALYDCPFTGAVTTRTSMLDGYPHDPAINQFALFETAAHDPAAASSTAAPSASLNTLGYSPLTLDTYLGFVQAIAARKAKTGDTRTKGFVVSVTGQPAEVAECYRRIAAVQRALPDPALVPLAMEINLSCPNIPNKPPPAYHAEALLEYLSAVQAISTSETPETPRIPVGIKTPPYTHAGQFATLTDALLQSAAATGVCPLSFLTAINTLGSSLVMTAPSGSAGPVPALPGAGIGGMAGAPLHPIALGNVATLRTLLDAHPAALGHIRLVGAGGVSDAGGFARMKSVGAYAVGVGTGLLVHGIGVFGRVSGSQ